MDIYNRAGIRMDWSHRTKARMQGSRYCVRFQLPIAWYWFFGLPIASVKADIIPPTYVAASSAHRERLIELNGQWCYTEAGKEFAAYCMMKLAARADVYRLRMLSASQCKKQLAGRSCWDSHTEDQYRLLDAEQVFAERSFLELTKQAVIFQTRLLSTDQSLRTLTSQHNELFNLVDKAMLAGQLSNDVPLSKPWDSGLYLKQRYSTIIQGFSTAHTSAPIRSPLLSHPTLNHLLCMTSSAWLVISLNLVDTY